MDFPPKAPAAKRDVSGPLLLYILVVLYCRLVVMHTLSISRLQAPLP